MSQVFWMVWSPQGRAPTHRHLSARSAKDEAERLASLNPGTEFIVLASVGTCVKREVQWTAHVEPYGAGPDDDLPF